MLLGINFLHGIQPTPVRDALLFLAVPKLVLHGLPNLSRDYSALIREGVRLCPSTPGFARRGRTKPPNLNGYYWIPRLNQGIPPSDIWQRVTQLLG